MFKRKRNKAEKTIEADEAAKANGTVGADAPAEADAPDASVVPTEADAPSVPADSNEAALDAAPESDQGEEGVSAEGGVSADGNASVEEDAPFWEAEGESDASSDFDNPVGLTEAFAPVSGDGSSAYEERDVSAEGIASDKDGSPIGLTEAFPPVPAGAGAHAGGFSYKGDSDDEYPDALESLEPHPEPAILNDDAMEVAVAESPARHGKDAQRGKKEGEIPPYLRKSRRMRKVLIAAIIVLVLLAAALGYFTFRLFQESQLVAKQQATQVSEGDDARAETQMDDVQDTVAEASKQTSVPNLAALLGLTQDEAIEQLQHGATAGAAREVNEEGNPIKSTVSVALTSEPADSRSGTPTVYLGFDEAGLVIQAGYSASVAALGYGESSFSTVVKEGRIVENTLQEAGVSVTSDEVVLPDRSEYSTYATDGKTLVRENCSFSGSADVNGVAHEWSATLSYDYTTANASGNLADTIRTVYVYVNA